MFPREAAPRVGRDRRSPMGRTTGAVKGPWERARETKAVTDDAMTAMGMYEGGETARPSPEFLSTARIALMLLSDRLDFDLWFVAESVDGRLVVLAAVGESGGEPYSIAEGRALDQGWPCYSMLVDRATRFAPHVEDDPFFAQTTEPAPVTSYIGAPIIMPERRPFGTLCGIDRQAKPEHMRRDLPLVEGMAALLSTVLAGEQRLEVERDRTRRAEEESLVDSLTGVSNRRAWDRFVEVEQERSKRYGTPASIVIVDLDHLKQINDAQGHAAGDAALMKTAEMLRSASRDLDIVGRIGGDEFAVLAVDCDRNAAGALVERLEAALAAQDITASLGFATSTPGGELAATMRAADEAMLRTKRSSRG